MTKIAIGSLVLLSALGIAACGGERERRHERHKERIDDRMDRRMEARTGWTKLGERMVLGRNDRDTIVVGGDEGRFGRMMIVVEHSALDMYDVEVTFGDGTKFWPGTRLVFAEDTRSRVIDLPGSQRAIRKVEFRYGNLPAGGRAQVELWAQ